MKFPVITKINGTVTFNIEALSHENAIEIMRNVSNINYGAEFCHDKYEEIIEIDDHDFSELNIRVVEWSA